MSTLLSPREREAAELLLQAKTERECAAVMGISFRTVKQHRAQLRRKLGERNHVRLALFIHEHRRELGVRCQACGEIE